AGLEVEQALVRGAAVGADEVKLRRPAMFECDVPQRRVAGSVGRVDDNADVHHYVDEQRLGADERREITALLSAQGEGTPGLNQPVAAVGFPEQVVLAQVGREE